MNEPQQSDHKTDSIKKIALLIATFFKIGKLPKAPGTFGTLAAIPLYYVVSYPGPLFHMAFVIFLFPLALWAAEQHEKQLGHHDAQEIVIDEVLGFLITMFWLPMTWQAIVFGFVLFRVLDILKPFPIGYLDKKVQGGLGVIADDVVAGIIANIILQIIYSQTNWLGMTFTMMPR